MNEFITRSALCDDNVAATFESVLWAQFSIFSQNSFFNVLENYPQPFFYAETS
jgi:hypothetical protein